MLNLMGRMESTKKESQRLVLSVYPFSRELHWISCSSVRGVRLMSIGLVLARVVGVGVSVSVSESGYS